MSGGFSDLVKVYIENLNLPKETKAKLLASNPKTLADVSMWLEENNKDTKTEERPSFNPFSSSVKTNLVKEIRIFSNNSNIISGNSNFVFAKDSLVDTDDASWGLSIDKTLSKDPDKTMSAKSGYDSSSQGALYSSSNTAVQKNSATNKTEKTSSTTSSTSRYTSAQTSSTNYAAESQDAVQQAQDNAIASIRENVNTSIEIIMQQMEEQGIISKAYNSLKEYFDSQMSMSSICRTLFAEKATADLLQRAQDGNLTKEEYWKTKISTAIDMLASDRELSAEERACLEERFAQYTPEELNQLTDKIKCSNQEDYTSLTGQLDRLIEEGRKLISAGMSDSNNVTINENPNSIKSLMKAGEGKELMSFNEVWKAERGVEFDPQAIEEYEQAAAEYAMVAMVNNKANELHELLKDSMTLVKGNNENAVSQQAREAGEKQLESNLVSALKKLYGDNEEKINQKLQEISGGAITYKDGQFVYNEYSKNNKGYLLLSSAQKLLDGVDENVKKVQGDYSLEDYKEKMASSYELAYGRKNATHMAQAFANDQEEIVGKVRTGVEIAGIGIMVGGMFIAPPAALAGALTASFGGIGVEALNEATRSKGLSEEAKKKIAEELMTNAALFAVGGAAGKIGTTAKAALLAQKCPTLMACVADIGADATISLLGDMVITGEIDIAGEGLSQLISVLAGHVRKVKFGKTNSSNSDINLHKTQNTDAGGISEQQHKQNLKELKAKYKGSKAIMSFIKKHINDREFIDLINKGNLQNAEIYNMKNITDDEIENLKYLAKVQRDEPISIKDMISFIMIVDNSQFKNLKDRGMLGNIEGRSNNLSISDMISLSQITDEQWKIIEERNLLKDIQGVSLDSTAIKALLNLSDEQYQKTLDRNLIGIAQSFCEDGKFDGTALTPFLNLSDEDWKKVSELLAFKDKIQMTPYEYVTLTSLDDESLEKVKKLLNAIEGEHLDIDSYALRAFSQIPDELLNQIKNSGKLSDINSEEIYTIIAFQKFAGKNSVSDLSKAEKREFMAKLMMNKTLFAKNNINLKDIIGILPCNEAEYAQMMRKISQSLNISTKPVSAEDKAKIENDLKQLAEILKNADLSDLEEINLTMPHTEFIAKAQELMQGLSDEEKAKVMEYFGFNIKDGKLSGYPNGDGKDLSLADISDPKTIEVVNKMKGLVDSYTDNNFITVKDHPELNAVLKEISRLVPEIFNQIDGSKVPVETIKALQKIVQKPEFDKLSDSDKKVLITATLLHNTDKASDSTTESAFDAYFIGEKMGLNKQELAKLYKIVEASDLIKKFMNTTKNATPFSTLPEREQVFNYLAFMLKDSNNFELAQMLYSTKEADGLTRHLDKLLQNKINEMKSHDFLLPQTSSAELDAHATVQNVKGYDVKVVNAADIPNFYVYIHALSGAATGGTEMTNIANFDIFGLVGDSSVICASYVGNGKAGTIGDAKYGLIFDVDPNNQHVGGNKDIWSQSKTVNQMLYEYFNTDSPKKIQEREFISSELKKILKISDEEYIKRLDNIKEKANGEPLTLEKIKEIDPQFGQAYETFLNRAANSPNSLMRSTHHNEILVTNPKVKGIFTKDINALPEDLIKYAQENNIPIVIVK